MRRVLLLTVTLLALAPYLASGSAIRSESGQTTNNQVNGFDAPSYAVVQDYGPFEERIYPSMNWVCTRRTTATVAIMDETQMIWKLIRYIGGNNNKGLRLSMTTPLNTRRKLLQGSSTPAKIERTVCFLIDLSHQSNPPQPTDTAVFIETRPELRVFTRSVGGYMTDSSWETEYTQLGQLVTAHDLHYKHNDYYTNMYDMPYKFYNRRNELWLIREDTE